MKKRKRSRRAHDGARRIRRLADDRLHALVKPKGRVKASHPRKPDGEVWVIDHTRIDVPTSADARQAPAKVGHPWVTVLISETTHELLDMQVSPSMPGRRTILRFIEKTAEKFGRPDMLRCDNGHEWTCLSKDLAEQGIEVTPYSSCISPRTSGSVERVLRTLSASLRSGGRKTP